MEKNHKKIEGYYRKFLIREGHKRNSLLLFLLGTPYWTLWLNRNEWIFRDTLISSPREIICRLIFFMQRWRIISSGKEWRALE
jgi:hypothetical protein